MHLSLDDFRLKEEREYRKIWRKNLREIETKICAFSRPKVRVSIPLVFSLEVYLDLEDVLTGYYLYLDDGSRLGQILLLAYSMSDS